jgi:predicted ester cyclase
VTPEQHKLAYRRLIEAGFNRGDPAVLNELLAPGFVVHGDPLALAATSRAVFPDLAVSVTGQDAAGDVVTSRWVARGVHHGALLGIPPTGRTVVVTGVSFARFTDGQLVEEWIEIDVARLLRQLGQGPLECFDTT